MPDVKMINDEIKKIDGLYSKTSGVKRFPSLIEKEFQLEYFKNHYYAARIALIFGYFLFTCGSIFIVAFFTDWKIPFSISMFFVNPILLVLLLLCFTKIYIKHQQIIILLFSLTILIGLALIAATSPSFAKDLIYQGMILPILFITTLSNLQFRYSIIMMITLMIASNISFYFSGYYQNMDSDEYFSLFANNYLLLGGSSLCLVASYCYEKYLRKQFLLIKLISLKNDLSEYLSNFDQLTDIPNRRSFDNILNTEWRRASRNKTPLGLIFLDFDYFKQYNDLYGHLLGDNALKLIAKTLESCGRRPGDFVARYGGDEFIILLVHANREATVKIAQLVQTAIKNLQIQHEGSDVSKFITTTMGIASIVPSLDISPYSLISQADKALNNGKKIQRNNIYNSMLEYKDT